MDGIEMQAALQALGDPHALIDRVVTEALDLIPAAEGPVRTSIGPGTIWPPRQRGVAIAMDDAGSGFSGQLEAARRLGTHQAQGHLFGRPGPIDAPAVPSQRRVILHR